MQHRKCCYCEQILVPDHNSVEHYRPYARYWWLAWTWENLLFACRACNGAGGKADKFPLAAGCAPLAFPDQPPGAERPVLIDPTVDDPRQHIRFVPTTRERWAPIGITDRGRDTIAILGLGRDTYLDLFGHHVTRVVTPRVRDIWSTYAMKHVVDFPACWDRKCSELLDPDLGFRALSEDVLRHEFPTFPTPPS
jgi:uncharacterized protein (TIGR02646 family)